MRVAIDTNIILDVLLGRSDFFDDSNEILKRCECSLIDGFITSSTITDIFYMTRKALGDITKTYDVIDEILNIVNILPVKGSDVSEAFKIRANDFEDCLLARCAITNKCDCIVTRDKKGFLNFEIPVYSPEEFLALDL